MISSVLKIISGIVKLRGGTDGTVIGNYGSYLKTIAKPYLYEIAEGKVPNHFPLRKFGFNADIDNVREDLWEAGGNYVFPPAGGIQMRIVSTSAADAAAGTGVRTIDIEYLDSTYTEQSIAITLNGTTPVNTVPTDILRIQGIHTMTAGSGGVAAGDILVQNTAGTVEYGRISAGVNVSRQAIWTVPAGKSAGITGWHCSSGESARFTEYLLRATATHAGEYTAGVFHIHDMTILATGGPGPVDLQLPIFLPQYTDIKISVLSDSASANARVSATIQGWYE